MYTRRPQKFTLSIGDVARRTGLTTSALRFYEKKALIGSSRTPGNQRCCTRDVIRRVSFFRAVLRVGLSPEEVRTILDELPTGRTPTREDWDQLGRAVQERKLAGLATPLDLLRHISPLGWVHILLTGEYLWRTMAASRA